MVVSDYTQDEDDIISHLIQESNQGVRLKSEWVWYANPLFINDPLIDRNSTIDVTARDEAPFEGQERYYYNRVDVTSFKFNGLIDDDFELDEETTLYALLPKINQRFNFKLTQAVIDDQLLPQPGGDWESQELSIPIKPNSLCYRGVLVITIDNPNSADNALFDINMNFDWPGV